MPRKSRLVKGGLKCPKCGRTFGMAAHLGRHMATIHGAPSVRSATRKRKVGRPKGSGGRRAGGNVASALGSLSLDELSQLIRAARAEARRKISAFHQAMK